MCGNIWAFENILCDWTGKQPFKSLSNANLLFIFLTILLTWFACSSHTKLWLIVIPSSLFEDTFSRYCRCILTLRVPWCSSNEALFCQVVMSITFVLVVVAAIRLSEHNFDTLSASFAKCCSISGAVLAEVVTDESSAYMSVSLLSRPNGRSFINSINNKGPMMDPCGHPVLIVNFSDDLSFEDCVLWATFKVICKQSTVVNLQFV